MSFEELKLQKSDVLHHVGVGGKDTAVYKSMYRVGVLTDLGRGQRSSSSSNDTITTSNNSIGYTTTTATTTTYAVAKPPIPPPLLVSPVHGDNNDNVGPNTWEAGGTRDHNNDHEDEEDEQDHLSWATLSEIDSQCTRRSTTRSTTGSSIRSHDDRSDSHCGGGGVVVVSDDEYEDDDENNLEGQQDEIINEEQGVAVPVLATTMPSLTGGGPPPPQCDTVDPTPRAGNLSSSLAYVEDDDDQDDYVDTIPRDIPVVQFHHQPSSPQRTSSSCSSTTVLNRSLQSGGDSTSETPTSASIHHRSNLPPTPPSTHAGRGGGQDTAAMEQQQQQQQIQQLQQDLEKARRQVKDARTALRLVEDELHQVKVSYAHQKDYALADQKQSLDHHHLASLEAERNRHQATIERVENESRTMAHRHQAILDDQEGRHLLAMQQLTSQLEELHAAKVEAETKLKNATAKLTSLQDDLEYQQESHAIALKEQEEQLTSSWMIHLDAVECTAQRKVQFAEERNSILEYQLSESADQLLASEQHAHKVEGQLVDTQKSFEALSANQETLRQTYREALVYHQQELKEVHATCTEARHQADATAVERDRLQSHVHNLEKERSQLQQQVKETKARIDDMVHKMRSKADEARQTEEELNQLREERLSLLASNHQLEIDRDENVESIEQKQMEREWVHTEQVQRLQARMERAREANEECRRHLDVICEESQAAQRRLDKVTLDFQTAKDELRESENRCVHLQHRVIELEELVKTLRKDKLRLLEEHESQTESLTNVLFQERSTNQAALTKIDELESQRDEVFVKMSVLQSHQSDLQSQLKELETSRGASFKTEQQTTHTLHSAPVQEASDNAWEEVERSNKGNKIFRGQGHHFEKQPSLIENRVTLSSRSLEKNNLQLSHNSQESGRLNLELSKLNGELEALRQTHLSTLQELNVVEATHAEALRCQKVLLDQSTKKLRVVEDQAAHATSKRDQLQEKASALLLGQEAMQQLLDKMASKKESVDRHLAKVLQEKDSALAQLSEFERRLKDAKNHHAQSIKQVESMKVVHALALDGLLLERDSSMTKLGHTQQELDEANEELQRAKNAAITLQLQVDTLQDDKDQLEDLTASIENDKTSMASQWGETDKSLKSALDQVALLGEEKKALQSNLDEAQHTLQRLENDLSKLQDDYEYATSQHALEIASMATLLETTERESRSLELQRDCLQRDISMIQGENADLRLELDSAITRFRKLRDVFEIAQGELASSRLQLEQFSNDEDELPSSHEDTIRQRDAIKEELRIKIEAVSTLERRCRCLESDLADARQAANRLQKEEVQLARSLPIITLDSTPVNDSDTVLPSDNDRIKLQLDQANVVIAGLQHDCSTSRKEKEESAITQDNLERQKDVLQTKVDKQANKIKKLSKILKKAFKDPFSSSKPVVTLDGTIAVPSEIDLSDEICMVDRVDSMCMQVKLQYRHKISGELCQKQVDALYTGPLLDSKPHGSGMLRFRGGDMYVCEFTNGAMDGSSGSFIRRRRRASKKGQQGGE